MKSPCPDFARILPTVLLFLTCSNNAATVCFDYDWALTLVSVKQVSAPVDDSGSEHTAMVEETSYWVTEGAITQSVHGEVISLLGIYVDDSMIMISERDP